MSTERTTLPAGAHTVDVPMLLQAYQRQRDEAMNRLAAMDAALETSAKQNAALQQQVEELTAQLTTATTNLRDSEASLQTLKEAQAARHAGESAGVSA